MLSAKCLGFAVSETLQKLGILCLLLSPCYAETEYRSVLIPIVDGVVGDPLVTRYRGPVSAEQIGLVANNSTEAIREANTAALQAAAAASVASGISLPPIQFGAGAYHFEDTLDVENALYRNGFRSAAFRGAGSTYAAQHMDNKGYTPNVTRIVVWGLDAGEFWWQERCTTDVEGVRTHVGQAAEPTLLSFEDLIFEIPTGEQGNFFYIGDFDYNSDQALMRGFYMRGCYGTHVDHFIRGSYSDLATAGGASTITLPFGAVTTDDTYNGKTISIVAGTGSGQSKTISDYDGDTQVATVNSAWSTPPDATSRFVIPLSTGTNQFQEWDDTDGYVLPDYRPTFLKLANIYDVSIEDCSARGWFNSARLQNCDCPKIDGFRTINCVRPLMVVGSGIEDSNWATNSWTAQAGVPGRISNVYSESDPCGLVFMSGMLSNTRREFGYSTIPCNLEAHAAMPAGIDWTGSVGAEYIEIENLPSGRDVDDYFLDYTGLELTPSESYQPARTVMITLVDAASDPDRLYFTDPANTNYIPSEITGDDTELRRLWAMSLFGGSRLSIQGFSVENNDETTSNVPIAGFTPYNNMLDVTGISGSGLAGDPHDLANHRPRLLLASAGTTSQTNGGVNWFGSGKQPVHPRAFCFGRGKTTDNYFVTQQNPATLYETFFRVGDGDMSTGNVGRSALYHPLTEEDGREVFAYKMDQLAAAWRLAPLRIDSGTGNVAECTVTARIYLDAAQNAAASNTITLYDGTSSHTTPVTGLGVGWHDITWVKDGVTLTAPASANLYLLQGATRNVFVEYVGINWE